MSKSSQQIFSRFTTLTAAESLTGLKSSDTQGLSETERSKRLVEHGFNELKSQTISGYKIFLRQFKSSFVYLLFGAAAIGFALGEVTDGIAILLFVLINAFLGFYQEYRSEKTVQMLQHYTRPTANVRVGGSEKAVTTRSLVPGDVIRLRAGDLVPADARLLTLNDFRVNESALTGESVPQEKLVAPLASQTNEMYQARCIVFSGTTVTSGSATALVVATGQDSVLGDVAKIASEVPRESAFEHSLEQFSTFILRLVLVTIAFVFLANLAIKHDTGKLIEFAIFSVALAVSVIPEALPVVTTFSLSRGASRLAKHHVVVKRLSAIEDLGSIEVLCTDKTGTLTENSLTIAEVYGRDRAAVIEAAALASSYCSQDEVAHDAFDIAVWQGLAKSKQDSLVKEKRISEVPFDPDRKRNSVLVQDQSGSRRLIVRGASETIVPFAFPHTDPRMKIVLAWIAEQGQLGRRVITVAQKPYPGQPKYEPKDEERNLELLGCISFTDPVKTSAIPALKQASVLGIAIKILTGDSREVAGSVGQSVGLVASPNDVVTGEQFDSMSPEEQLEAAEQYQVFARVSPQQKYRIIQILQGKHMVGFLGEGINDAPALKIANVALVVSGASDVAREAADIVLLEKSLAVVVDGIREGREVFANTIKYIKATLASNFGNFYAVAIASLLINYLPMLPLQILLVNLLSDFPMIAVATDSVDADETRHPRSYQVKEIALLALVLGITSTVFDFIFFAIFSRISPEVLQTNWFIGSILTELVFIYSIRTKFFFARSSRPSHILTGLTAVAALFTILIPFTPIGSSVFHFTPPLMSHLMLDLGLVATYFVVTEIVKLLYYRINKPKMS